MKQLTLHQPGELRLSETDRPGAPGPGEALVRVHRVGICGTDLHAYGGRQPFFEYPRVLGHELGVEVVEVGPGVTDLKPGDGCAVEPYLYCGNCLSCRSGKTNCCMHLRVLGVHVDGGLQEYLWVPARQLHPSAGLSFEQLALVETLGIGAHAVERAQLGPADTVLVLGAGPIGLAVIQFVVLRGISPLVADIDSERRRFCARTYAVGETLAADEHLLERILTAGNGELPTVVFDATGNATSMQQAFGYVAHGGRLVYVGLVRSDIRFHDPEFHRKELTLLASRNATAAEFRRIINLMETGRIQTTPWITHQSTLSELPDRFPAYTRPGSGVVKALVHVS